MYTCVTHNGDGSGCGVGCGVCSSRAPCLTLMVGEELHLFVLPKDGNVHNQHPVAVIRGDKIVGHTPHLLHFLRSLLLQV